MYVANVPNSGYFGPMSSDGIRALAARQLKRHSRVLAKRQLTDLPERLQEGEHVVHLAFANRGTSCNLLAATDRRLLVLYGRRSDQPDALPYDSMRSMAAHRARILGSSIEIGTESGEVVLSGIREQFEEMCRLIHARIWEADVARLGEHATINARTLVGRGGFTQIA